MDVIRGECRHYGRDELTCGLLDSRVPSKEKRPVQIPCSSLEEGAGLMEYEARYGTMVLKELCDTPPF